MKVFVLNPNENWVVDRFTREWKSEVSGICADNPLEADILWLMAGWCWNQIDPSLLSRKKVVLTIHHIVPEKFDETKIREFQFRDQFIDVYHVPCEKTKQQISGLTSKQIFVAPFWANSKLWFEIKDSSNLRKKFNIDKDCYLVGSFQRDTEGHDLISPKLEKGPDLFCDRVISLSKEKSNLKVLLAGWRRQYVINRLSDANIPFYYFELPDFNILNELYNCLDLYLVTARHEGGPQSVVECSLTRTPIISTDVGIARDILSPESIIGRNKEATPDTVYAYNKVQGLCMPEGMIPYIDFFNRLCNEQTQ